MITLQKALKKFAELTPVEKVEKGLYLKRDDLLKVGHLNGSEMRATLSYINGLEDLKGLTVAGSRVCSFAPIGIFAGRLFDVPVRVHMSHAKKWSRAIVREVSLNKNIELFTHAPGYLEQIHYRSRLDSQQTGFPLHEPVPLKRDQVDAINCTARQVENIPGDVKTLIVTVSTEMVICGILKGLKKYRRKDIDVVAVTTGYEENYKKAIINCSDMTWGGKISFVACGIHYFTLYTDPEAPIPLDTQYESKTWQFVKKYKRPLAFWVSCNQGNGSELVDAPVDQFILCNPPKPKKEKVSLFDGLVAPRPLVPVKRTKD